MLPMIYGSNDIQKVDYMMVLAVATVMFFLTLSALASIGFVPAYIDGIYPVENDTLIYESEQTVNDNADEQVALSSLPQLGEQEALIQPERVVIHSIGVDLPILNPTDTDVEILDEELLKGVVRYPTSGELNQDGNMFVFGHSSRVSVVKNQMYRAFNRIGELRGGDTIKIMGDGEAHIYRVNSVRSADASEALIDLSPTDGRKLTLSTCDSFTSKTSRIIVEASFIGSYKE
jgi:LPXTG-site transpeptidase (sortase) family protein